MTKDIIHNLDPKIAIIVGANAALVYQKIAFFMAYHEVHNSNFHDGRYWVYYSYEALAKQFDYLSPKQIRLAINKLLEAKLMVRGNYNKFKNDRTIWYSVENSHLPIRADGLPKRASLDVPKKADVTCAQTGKPLPEDTLINTNYIFEEFWKNYPETEYANKANAVKAFNDLTALELEQLRGACDVYAAIVRKANSSFVIAPQKFIKEKNFQLEKYQPKNVRAKVLIPIQGSDDHKLYEAMVGLFNVDAWVSWMSGDRIIIEDGVAKAKSEYAAQQISSRYVEAFEMAGLKFGGVA